MLLPIQPLGWSKRSLIAGSEPHLRALRLLYGEPAVTEEAIETVRITIEDRAGVSLVRVGEETVQTETPFQTVNNLLFEQTEYLPSLFPLHGGAIETGGLAHLFLASTGAGKTTLITYLSHLGYPYINDDRVLVDMDTLFVLPSPAPIRLRPGSLPVLARYGCEPSGEEVRLESLHRIVLMPGRVAADPLPIGGIYLLERTEDGNSCVPIPSAQAVQLLMQSLISPHAIDSTRLRCAVRLAPLCRHLRCCDMRYVADLLKSLPKKENTP